jgi:hypothetical protein
MNGEDSRTLAASVIVERDLKCEDQEFLEEHNRLKAPEIPPIGPKADSSGLAPD